MLVDFEGSIPFGPSTPYITPTKTFTIIRHFYSPRIIEGFRYASDNPFPSPIRAHRLAPRVNLGNFWAIDKWRRVSLLLQILAYSEKKSLSFRWTNTLLIPLIATFISGGSLLVRVVLRLWSRSRRAQNVLKPREGLSEDEAEQTMVGRLQKQSKSQGGLVIVAFKTARFLCCLALFSLSLLSIIVEESGHRNLELTGIFEGVNVSELAVAFTFVRCRTFFVQACLWFHLNFKWYSSFLAFVSLTSGSWSRLITQHNNLVLLTTFGIYAYRDIWPLATYSQGPVDISEGPLLWVKLGLLTLVAVMIPLFIPRQYIPVDPKVRVLRPYFRMPSIDWVHRILWKYQILSKLRPSSRWWCILSWTP